MVTERSICLDGKTCTAVISDEPEALLAAKAAGRAVVGVESERTGIWELKGIPYVIPDIEDATDELLDLVIRRHLGLPWNICRTDRLLIRELTADDACHIPEEEYGPEEAIFRLRDTLELYCRNQYGFYEYGTWALVRRDDQVLVGLAGVSNPRLKRGDGGMSGLHGTVCSLAGIGIPCFPALPAAGILRGSCGGHCRLQP